MTLNENLTNFFDKSSLAFMKTIPFNALIFDLRSKYMCKFGCKNFQRKYSCPPASLSIYNKIKNNTYQWATLFSTTSEIPENTTYFKRRILNYRDELLMQKIVNKIDNIFQIHNSNHVTLSNGSCHKCKICSFIENQPCKKPEYKYASMEAVMIDCQKTMHKAGFDFQMPNNGSINRCGCILSNEKEISDLTLNKKESLQSLIIPSKKDAVNMCKKLLKEYPKFFQEVYILPINKIDKNDSICNLKCKRYNKNFSCPPYSKKIPLNLWNYAIIWKWRKNKFKKYRYNLALKKIHSAFFSLGFYFSLSLRDCYCDECDICTYSVDKKNFCNYRKMLAPSMQSQRIDPINFGNGKYGIELL